MKVPESVVEILWFIWDLIVAGVIITAFIAFAATLLWVGFDCGLDDQCVERIYMVVDAAKG